jgi:hypothetical protein
MKVALCITGLARKVQEGYDQYFKHILDNYETDVYLHYWVDDNYDEYQKVLQIYKPKNHIALKPFSFKQYQNGVDVADGMDSTSRPMSQYDIKGCFTSLPLFYGWQIAFNLIEEDYDCVIRSRYDIGGIPLDIEKLDLAKINISGNHWAGSHIPDDNFSACNAHIAKILYSDVFDTHVKIINDEKKIYHQELNFYNILQKKNLHHKIHKTNIIDFKLLREFKVWY